MGEQPLATLIQPIELIISAIVCAALKLISPTTIEHKFSLAARGRESCLNKLAHAANMLSFAHFTCHMPHATQKHQPQLAPNWKFAQRGSLFGIRRKETGPHTVSFLRLHNSQLQLFFLVLSLSPSLFSLLAAATHKNRSCQFKKPKPSVPASIFHTPANLSPPLDAISTWKLWCEAKKKS